MKYVQTMLTDEEYESFVGEAQKKGLSLKKALNLALKSWVEQGGRVFIEGVGREVLIHPIFEGWQDFFCDEYVPPCRHVLFVTSCFWGKPFHESWIFREIRRVVGERDIHFVALSCAGLVPFEYWDTYPFNSYDSDPWKFSPRDRQAFAEINGRRVGRYLSRNGTAYKMMLVYLPGNDAALRAVREGHASSRCALPLRIVEEVKAEEEKRSEDYYACLARAENLARLGRALEEIE